MKIKIFLSIALVIAIISSNIVISVSASSSENMQDYIVNEEPFEFEYLPGDMAIANLATATDDLEKIDTVIRDSAYRIRHITAFEGLASTYVWDSSEGFWKIGGTETILYVTLAIISLGGIAVVSKKRKSNG